MQKGPGKVGQKSTTADEAAYADIQRQVSEMLAEAKKVVDVAKADNLEKRKDEVVDRALDEMREKNPSLFSFWQEKREEKTSHQMQQAGTSASVKPSVKPK